MIKKIIFSSLLILFSVGFLGSTTTLAMVMGPQFTDPAYPGLAQIQVPNVNLVTGTITAFAVPAGGLCLGQQENFTVTAINTSTILTNLTISLDNFTALPGTGIYAQKGGDKTIGTSGDLANITTISMWVDASNGQHTTPQAGDYILNYGTSPTILDGAVGTLTPFSANVIYQNPGNVRWNIGPMKTASNQFLIHYILGLPSNAGNGIEGESGFLGSSMLLHSLP